MHDEHMKYFTLLADSTYRMTVNKRGSQPYNRAQVAYNVAFNALSRLGYNAGDLVRIASNAERGQEVSDNDA